jgi:hypothetical protein
VSTVWGTLSIVGGTCALSVHREEKSSYWTITEVLTDSLMESLSRKALQLSSTDHPVELLFGASETDDEHGGSDGVEVDQLTEESDNDVPGGDGEAHDSGTGGQVSTNIPEEPINSFLERP